MNHRRTIASAVMILLAAGCRVSPQVEIPVDAELVWLGPVDGQFRGEVGDYGQMFHHEAGQVYLVEDGKGRVEGVNSVTADHPKLTFSDIPAGKYRLYFVATPQPSTRPLVIKP